jgi:hypothetical protein
VIEEGWLMTIGPDPVPDNPRIGGRVALLAIAGSLLIIFLTLFVVGLTLGEGAAVADAPPTLAPTFPSATALLTVAPQTPSSTATATPRSGGGGTGRPTATPIPTTISIPPTPPLPTYTPTISSGGG